MLFLRAIGLAALFFAIAGGLIWAAGCWTRTIDPGTVSDEWRAEHRGGRHER